VEGQVNWEVLTQLAADFSVLSLIAVGGAITVLPEMHRSVVDVHGWMSAAQFAELFALAQASPGPNILVVSLIGWKVAGVAGAVVATAAMCGPSCVLAFAVSRVWQRFRGSRWRAAAEDGLVPVTVGLMLAGGYLITLSADASIAAFAITAVTAAAVLSTRIHPLWCFAAAGLMGLAGWV
jgi:chromate transporter